MKSWLWIVLACGLIVMVSAITVEAQHVKIAKNETQAATNTTAEPVVLSCPKCQNAMEQGFFLDIQGPAINDKGPVNWVQGPIQGSFWSGVKVKNKRPVVAFRCTNCGFLELYAK